MIQFNSIVLSLIILVSFIKSTYVPGSPWSETVWISGNIEEVKWSWQEKDGTPKIDQIDYIVVDFMTGSDYDNILLQNVATLPPNATNTLFKVPKVSQDGKLYFFRITSFNKTNAAIDYNWSTRFTILSANPN
ncbi:hypothetical protein CONCODRAFT_80142 [Conidiobolus coronatus NRRL 28638]|uniref:Yeast cell wall synthesis Kre9/Knh1-like N-terminal domain-containing protein n=1 Tax=Conidiobolus coronatus (strain ATCC 28846 / CBS 209.66 / NRRL 28638) TaxID=796925 RepID=A0A137NXX9_CONC2|nr:hypothetical protein CONCODRAFT_80142 [Conidiobolus coronatus NRRL 28638]|eukprot:KXN67459.1 hypothetical protein CONCODRAFT_80142 [Conidiobolus coronatus NRRL 28638]